MTESKDKPAEAAFEDSLSRLEVIVRDMESGRLSLDQMLAHFEEGMTLVKSCGAKLDQVEKKIEQLIRKEDTIGTEPFELDSGK